MDLEQTIDRNVAAFVNLFETRYLTTTSEYKPVDFCRKAQYFTLDVISDVAHGKALGFISTDTDVHAYIKTTAEVFPVIMLVTEMPWLNKVLQTSLVKMFLPTEKDPLGFGKIIGLVSPSFLCPSSVY